MLAAGRLAKFDNAANQGSASWHAPSAFVSRSPENVNRRSSHTQPHTVQATSENVCGVLAWLCSNAPSSSFECHPMQIAWRKRHGYHHIQRISGAAVGSAVIDWQI